MELCSQYDPDFKSLIEDAGKINPYSVLYRYPNVVLEPEEKQVHEAIDIAEKLLTFVESKVETARDTGDEPG